MDKAFILAEMQALIDKLHIEGYTISLARLVVSKNYESFETVLKGAKPTKAAQDARVARVRAEQGDNLF